MPLTFENNTANLLLEHMSPDEREFGAQEGLRYLGIRSFWTKYLKHQRKILFYDFGRGVWTLLRIAVQTRDGLTSPETRKEHFFQISLFSSWDLIYRAGVESAPPLRGDRKESYKFEGVPNDSPVRRYLNEYLL